MHSASFSEEEFKAGLDRLGERDVLKLVQGGALDGDEARWAAAWLRGDRTAAVQTQYVPYKLAS